MPVVDQVVAAIRRLYDSRNDSRASRCDFTVGHGRYDGRYLWPHNPCRVSLQAAGRHAPTQESRPDLSVFCSSCDVPPTWALAARQVQEPVVAAGRGL